MLNGLTPNGRIFRAHFLSATLNLGSREVKRDCLRVGLTRAQKTYQVWKKTCQFRPEVFSEYQDTEPGSNSCNLEL